LIDWDKAYKAKETYWNEKINKSLHSNIICELEKLESDNHDDSDDFLESLTILLRLIALLFFSKN